MPPTACGDSVEQISMRSVPSSPIRSNFASARSKARVRCSPVSVSKSRKGWNTVRSSPWSRIMRPTSRALPSKVRKSISNSSTPSKPAAAMAASFSFRSPLIETVAMEVFMRTPGAG
jgi:hypothetical protein